MTGITSRSHWSEKINPPPNQNGQEEVERPERQSVSVKTKIERAEEGEIDVRKERVRLRRERGERVKKKKTSQELLLLGRDSTVGSQAL